MQVMTKRDWYSGPHICVNVMKSWPADVFCQEIYMDATGIFGLRNTVQTQVIFFRGTASEIYGECVTRAIAGTPIAHLRVYEGAPDDAIIVQGEYDGLHARLSYAKTMMRLIHPDEWFNTSRGGLLAIVGYENYVKLNDMLDAYNASVFVNEGHVVEFSLYSRAVGVFDEEMIIWEVRRY